jgi:protein gp37
MGEVSAISWTDATFNPWWGCTKVGPGCDHCYAEAFDKRIGGAHWGAGVERRYFGDKHWNEPLKWDRKAAKTGGRLRVFCASMADVFDNEVAQIHRERLWGVIAQTPNLDWLLTTKRIGNAADMGPAAWPANVWVIITTVNQAELDRDARKLFELSVRVRALSVEPQLDTVSIADYPWLDWVICGGESSHHARPFHIEWASLLQRECAGAGIAFHMKQAGAKPHMGGKRIYLKHDKGGDPSEWPESLRVREFPDERQP